MAKKLDKPVYFPLEVLEVIDGDTLTVRVTLLFGIQYQHPLRLAGINCPELSTPQGITAQTFTKQWLFNNPGPYTLATKGTGRDKYGRLLGVVTCNSNSKVLNTDLLQSGNAVVMKGVEQ